MKKLLMILCVLAVGACQEDTAIYLYEEVYAQPGSYSTEVLEVTDSAGDALYRLCYPINYDAALPVVVWGNGTDALPDNYQDLFIHLASHGFTIIDTYSKYTGTGAEINEAINYIAQLNEDANSTLYQKLDTQNLGLAGHSQGSTGVINAHTNFSNALAIKTIVSIALPALHWCDPEDKYNTADIDVPFLILSGTNDFIISPTSSNEEAIDKTQDIPAAMLMVKKAGHTEIQGDGGLLRGFLTAWLSMHLKEQDTKAKQIFQGTQAEVRRTEVLKSVFIKGL